jgi:two-component system, OmpR family, response regulator
MRSVSAVTPGFLTNTSNGVNQDVAPGPPTVLIVDDDDAFRKQLRSLFVRDSGFEACVEAQNAAEALSKATRLSPALAVLNFSLPDMNGLELAQRLRANASELPIFMLTTDYNLDVEKLALSCAITAVFSKLDDLAMLVPNARAACGIE